MKVEEQLDRLAALGIRLDPGITVDDLTGEIDRKKLEGRPFDLLLIMLGNEVDRDTEYRPVCSQAWSFDAECVYDDGDYVLIVRSLLRVAGKPADYFKNVEDHIDFDGGEAWLEYQLPNGEWRRFEIELSDDWVDEDVVSSVVRDIESDGSHFYSKDNGQAQTVYYLDDAAAEALEDLAPGGLTRMVPDEGAYL